MSSGPSRKRPPARRPVQNASGIPIRKHGAVKSEAPNTTPSTLLEILSDPTKISASSLKDTKKLIQELDLDARRSFVMQVLNAISTTINQIYKTGWTRGVDTSTYTEERVQAICEIGNAALSALRSFKVDINSEKAALSLVGRLLALRMFEPAFSMAKEVKVNLETLLLESSPAAEPADTCSSYMEIRHQANVVPDLVILVVKCLSYILQLSLHSVPNGHSQTLVELFHTNKEATKRGDLLCWLQSSNSSNISEQLLPICTAMLKSVDIGVSKFSPLRATELRIYAVQCVLSVATIDEARWIWRHLRNVTSSFKKSARKLNGPEIESVYSSVRACVDIAETRMPVHEFENEPGFVQLKELCPSLGDVQAHKTARGQKQESSSVQAVIMSIDRMLESMPDGDIRQELQSACQGWKTALNRTNEDVQLDHIFRVLERFRRRFINRQGDTVVAMANRILLTTYTTIHSIAALPSSLAPHVLSGIVEIQIYLSKVTLDKANPGTYEESYQHLEAASSLISGASDIDKDRQRTNDLLRCISGASWNQGSILYQANHWDHSIPFIAHGVSIDQILISCLKDGRIDSQKDAWSQFFSQMPRRISLLGGCYMRLGENKTSYETYIKALECWLILSKRDLDQKCPVLSSAQINATLFSQLSCGIIGKITTIGAFNLRLGPELSLAGVGEQHSLSMPLRGSMIESQIQTLARGSRKGRLDAVISHLFDTATHFYSDEHPIRLARLLLVWLEYAYCRGYGSDETQRRFALIRDSLDSDPKMDLNLIHLRTQYRLLWHCWQCIYAHKGCDKRLLEQNAASLLEIIINCTGRDALRSPDGPTPDYDHSDSFPAELDDADWFWGTLERTWKLFGVIGLVEMKLYILDATCRLLRSRGYDKEKQYYFNTYAALADQCLNFELYEQSKKIFEECEIIIRDQPIAATEHSAFLLRYAYFLVTVGDLNKGKELYTEAQAIISGADWGLANNTDPIYKLRCRIKRSQLAALACSTHARIKLADALLSDALQSYLQALRIFNSVIEAAQGILEVESTPKERNPFDMTDMAGTLPETGDPPDGAQETRTRFYNTAQIDGLNWELANHLLNVQLAIARHHILKGTYREAEYFAQEASCIAGAILAPIRLLMVNSLQLEIALHLRSASKSSSYLPKLDLHSKDEPFIGHAYMLLLLAFNRERNGDTEEAKSYLDSAFASLAATNARLLQAGLDTNKNATNKAQESLAIALLHRRAFLSMDESQDELLDDLNQLDNMDAILIMRSLLVCKVASDQTTKIFNSHPDLQSIGSSSLKLPLVPKRRSKKSWNGAESQLVEVLAELEEHSKEATQSIFLRGAVHQLREACMTLVFALVSQLTLKIEDDEKHWLVAHLLDTSAAPSLEREMLDCIISRREKRGTAQDLQWPDLVQQRHDIPPTSRSSSLSFQLDIKPEQQDIYDQFWNSVEQRLRSSSIEIVSSGRPLPATWTVITISYDEARNTLIVARNRQDKCDLFKLPLKRGARREHDEEPEVLPLGSVVKELDDIIASSVRNGRKAAEVAGKGRNAKARWWAERSELDDRLKTLLENMEYCWFGGFKTIFSKRLNMTRESLMVLQNGINSVFDEVIGTHGRSRSQPKNIDPSLVECMASLTHDCKDEELEDLAYYILDSHQLVGHRLTERQDMMTILKKLRNILKDQVKDTELGCLDEHMFLVLDKELQGLPFESMPILRGRPVSRIPSLSFLLDRLDLARMIRRGRGDAATIAAADGLPLDPANVFYLLNPEGDLKRTEETFAPWLRQMSKVGWKGIIGRRPNVFEVQQALETADLFIYFGHGGAEQYIRGSKIRALNRCASTMLWGCSSGHMAYAGDFDRSGTPYNYLLAGCPLLVANLWDVTDRDIDKFAHSVFSMLRLDAEM
ncbi:Separase; AltName: Full=Protein EXTRA SPINDLE POLES; Short=AtESP; AltName: Full=Protein RADIALLY SWOLLEN 4 [Serendipita indica DSM 11827]|nr:Separase; AltName: Full=Protein EXTRA SPINDLE POLES; Short=AtESP; AltName: Full=Protein RADIALLY SWOLLEN 4 [Serendipita indica DSM 11827]